MMTNTPDCDKHVDFILANTIDDQIMQRIMGCVQAEIKCSMIDLTQDGFTFEVDNATMELPACIIEDEEEEEDDATVFDSQETTL